HEVDHALDKAVQVDTRVAPELLPKALIQGTVLSGHHHQLVYGQHPAKVNHALLDRSETDSPAHEQDREAIGFEPQHSPQNGFGRLRLRKFRVDRDACSVDRLIRNAEPPPQLLRHILVGNEEEIHFRMNPKSVDVEIG